MRRVVANYVPKLDSLAPDFHLAAHQPGAAHLFPRERRQERERCSSACWRGDQQYPAARVAPADGELTWIIGEAGLTTFTSAMRTIIVTGSAGLIGSETVKHFARDGLSRASGSTTICGSRFSARKRRRKKRGTSWCELSAITSITRSTSAMPRR